MKSVSHNPSALISFPLQSFMHGFFECAAPLNSGRGSPTTTRLLCIIANSPSPGSYSAVVGKESDHSRSLSSPLSGDQTDSFTSTTVYKQKQTPSGAAEQLTFAALKEPLWLLFGHLYCARRIYEDAGRFFTPSTR